MNYVGLGRRIRKHRKALSMTQEQLSDMADISLSFLGHIERGSRKASMETLIKLAIALNVGTDDLLIDSLPHVPTLLLERAKNIGSFVVRRQVVQSRSAANRGMTDSFDSGAALAAIARLLYDHEERMQKRGMPPKRAKGKGAQPDKPLRS